MKRKQINPRHHQHQARDATRKQQIEISVVGRRRGRCPAVAIGDARHQGVAAPERLITVAKDRALMDIIDGDDPDIGSSGETGIEPHPCQHLRKDRIDCGADDHNGKDQQKQGHHHIAPAGPADDEPARCDDDRHQPEYGLAA
ncbi:hypothetical protein D3C87_1513450 [compost metagenome]